MVSDPVTSETVTSEPTASEIGTSGTSSTVSETYTPPFELASLKGRDVTTYESTVTLSGSSDITLPLTLNGEEVSRYENGGFSLQKELSVGKNTFTFKCGETEYVYTVTYKYVIIDSFSPTTKQMLDCGSVFSVNVKARAGSRVTAQFNGETIELTPEILASSEVNEGDFVDFIGSFSLPDGNVSDDNLGKVKFTAIINGITDIQYSGNIICKKDVNVNYIAEIIADFAETFNGNTADDNSNPHNNYLPQGTVDYCDAGIVYYKKGTSSEKRYYKLRCGRRVYISKTNLPNGTAAVTKRYVGTLPDHNELTVRSVETSGHHTNITLSTLFKAPFLLDLLPQKYANESSRNFTVSETTYEYVQITFMYATSFTGELKFPNSRVISHATVTPDGTNTVVKLYLKEKGAFYGWDSRYNENGELVLSFLEPAAISYTDQNEYGVDLTGVTILIDAGHGGKDSGSYGIEHTTHAKKYQYSYPYEQAFNLSLAYALKSELEKTGATVIMTRTAEDQSVSADARCKMLHDTAPDYCISIHHNGSSDSTKVNGYDTYHSTVFSSDAAKMVNSRVTEADIYNSTSSVKWHYFFLARMTACPVVLTENGYMTNPDDYYDTIANKDAESAKARALATGIVDYFKSIQ